MLLVIGIFVFLLSRTLPALGTATAESLPPDPVKASVVLDGRELFKLGSSGRFSAVERAEMVSHVLQEKLHRRLLTDELINVEAITQQNQAILQVNNRYLLTVTAADVIPGMEPIEQARLWEKQLETALERGTYEHSLPYKHWAGKSLAIGFGVALAVQSVLFFLSRRYRRQQLQRSEVEQGSLQLLGLNLLQFGVWIVWICYGMSLFPWTRTWLYQGFQLLDQTFNTSMFRVGEEAISLSRLLGIGATAIALWIVIGWLTRFLKTRILPLAGVDRSLQDSIAFFVEYGLISLGLLLILSAGGVSLQSLIFLLSAVGIGIGFGLQNIAKDFISGLILLVTRPIKIGELVQVGEFQGLVQRIGARTIEISHIDRYVITIPNSRFIEGEVLNWNRSGLTRVKVYADISYGIDFELIHRVLLAAAQAPHPDILRHPPPKAQFRGYQASSLKFRIVVFIRDPLKEPKVRTHLYNQIEYHLRKYNIEVPFPQQDLHIKVPQLDQAIATWVQINAPEDDGLKAASNLEQSTTLLPELPIVQDEYDWEAIAAAMRGENGVEIKDRRFRLRVFAKTFLGSDAVNWLMINEQATRPEAIMIGQLMVKQHMIHHALDEHDFKDEPLFYRFYADEIDLIQQGMADEGGIEGDKKDGLENSSEGSPDSASESSSGSGSESGGFD
ncbi:MAG: mechanosensitive ion channel domain-containing protein [Microcoleaceae cyanobacterium]